MTEIPELSFRPERRRAQSAVREMKRRLADSLHHIIEQSREHLVIDEARLQPMFRALDGCARVQPELFGTYNDMLSAIAADDITGLAALFNGLYDRPVAAGPLRIRAYDPREFGPDEIGRIRRYFGSEAAAVSLFEPSEDDVRFSRERLGQALDVLRRAAPECFEEIDSILSEIILVAGDPALRVPDFLGISTFELWGAIVINPAWRHETVFDIAEDLVHETTHELLFAFCLDEPMVLNPGSDRFASPLRADPRPMDGIFHATYVIARMHYALSRMRTSAIMNPDEMDRSLVRLKDYEKRFGEGLAVIREHGNLTSTGRQVLEGAEDYMAGQAA